jgi:hypothetical protein
VGKPEGKILLGRPRHRWEDGSRMDLRETIWGSVVWIHLAQGRDRWRVLVNTVMNLRVLGPRRQNTLILQAPTCGHRDISNRAIKSSFESNACSVSEVIRIVQEFCKLRHFVPTQSSKNV